MAEDRYFDGNVLAGMFLEFFGREMTDQLCCCGHCNAVNALGATHVYMEAPGHVIRCPSCAAVLMVIVNHPNGARFHFELIGWLQTQS